MPSSAPHLSVVIPAYNEERRLPATLAAVCSYLARQPFTSELIVADDGSTDSTVAVSLATPGVVVLQLPHRGKGCTVRDGVLAARGDTILVCDADLATPIEEWEKLGHWLGEGYDLAIGSREGHGAVREGEPWHRHVMGRIFNRIVALAAISGISDTQCGFKAFRRPAATELFSRVRLYGEGAPVIQDAAVTAYDVEVLFLARLCGYQIAEVPVIWRYGQETKVDALRDSWRNLRDVIRIRCNAWRGLYRSAEGSAVDRAELTRL